MNTKEQDALKQLKFAEAKKLPEDLVKTLARDPTNPDQLVNAADMLGELYAEASDVSNPLALTPAPTPAVSGRLTEKNLMSMLQQRIAKLDEMINEGLSNTMHDPGFQTRAIQEDL
jgi:predicted component of type VI protein secretion system